MRSPFKTGLITVKNADGEEVSMTTPIDTNPKRKSFKRIRSNTS